MNNAEHSRRDDALGILLGGPTAEGMDTARSLVLEDPALREEFESLNALAVSLEEVGNAFHQAAGTIDITDALFDSIAHMAFEEFAVAKGSPYGQVERELRAFKKSFDAQVGKISLVADIMAAVAASSKSDAEVERSFAPIALELNSLGTLVNARAPEVELVEPVMEQVARSRSAVSTVTPFRARPAVSEARMVSRRRVSWPAMLGWAAAAALCATSSWIYFGVQRGDGPTVPNVARNTSTGNSTLNANQEPVLAEVTPYAGGQDGTPPADTGLSPGDAPLPRAKEPVALQDAINARRKDLVSQGNDFELLASLTGEEASSLLKSMDLSVEALLGAAQFLSTDEAIAVLRTAIVEHPDDPYLKYALALNLEGDPKATEERMQQLAQLAASDTKNSLPQYMLASEYLAKGDMAQALDALSKGSSYGDASAYTLESARQREAAFAASGLDRDTARFLALSTSGDAEYSNIAALRNELLDFGAEYEKAGDYDTAQQIYNAVNQLGQQLYEGASMAVEQQYGLETQQEAILAIQGIAEIFQQPETVALLGDTLGVLASGIVNVTQYISARQQMVTNPVSSGQTDWAAFLNHVMNNGDLNVSNFVH